MKKQIQPLTEQESAFAAEHHSLVFRYLSQKGLPEEEYYDIVVFGYLGGVQKYFRQKSQRDSFSALVWREMDASLFSYEKTETYHADTLSIHESVHSAFVLEEMISDARDYAEETLDAMHLQETLESFEQTEREIVRLLMEGYPKSEVRRQLGLTAGQMCDLLAQIQTKTMSSPLMRAA